jgi:hypothetical protein
LKNRKNANGNRSANLYSDAISAFWVLNQAAMGAGVVETVSTKEPDFYQALWLGEKDETPLIYPDPIAATKALGGLRRLW